MSNRNRKTITISELLQLNNEINEGVMEIFADLEGDKFADESEEDSMILSCSLVQVVNIEQETENCIRVDFEGFQSVGFPANHEISVEIEEVEEGAKVIDAPLNYENLARKSTEDSWVNVIVPIDIESIIHNDYEGFLDLLSQKVLGNDLLLDIHYEVVGSRPSGEILVKVSGDFPRSL